MTSDDVLRVFCENNDKILQSFKKIQNGSKRFILSYEDIEVLVAHLTAVGLVVDELREESIGVSQEIHGL